MLLDIKGELQNIYSDLNFYISRITSPKEQRTPSEIKKDLRQRYRSLMGVDESTQKQGSIKIIREGEENGSSEKLGSEPIADSKQDSRVSGIPKEYERNEHTTASSASDTSSVVHQDESPKSTDTSSSGDSSVRFLTINGDNLGKSEETSGYIKGTMSFKERISNSSDSVNRRKDLIRQRFEKAKQEREKKQEEIRGYADYQQYMISEFGEDSKEADTSVNSFLEYKKDLERQKKELQEKQEKQEQEFNKRLAEQQRLEQEKEQERQREAEEKQRELAKREEELRQKEAELKAQEALKEQERLLAERQKELEKKERLAELQRREEEIRKQEEALKRREQELEDKRRENELKYREEELKRKEQELEEKRRLTEQAKKKEQEVEAAKFQAELNKKQATKVDTEQKVEKVIEQPKVAESPKEASPVSRKPTQDTIPQKEVTMSEEDKQAEQKRRRMRNLYPDVLSYVKAYLRSKGKGCELKHLQMYYTDAEIKKARAEKKIYLSRGRFLY